MVRAMTDPTARDLIQRLADALVGLRKHAAMFNRDTDEMWVAVKEAVDAVEAEARAYLATHTARDLIQRLADALTAHGPLPGAVPLLNEARAYLAASDGPAVPAGREPTDEELASTYWKAWHEYHDRTNSVLHAAGLRAVLARWGNR
jgi:hypothetical protein